MPTYDIQLVAAPMPTLENLKKQAKQYLRWHREKYYPVAARIRSLLPRFQHLSDSEVLEVSFKLSDAQELVARENGFDGWRALKTGTQVMTTEPKQGASRIVLNSTTAQLFVADVKASSDFFTTALGFELDFLYGDPPYYGVVKRGNGRIALRLVCEPVFVGDIREREHLLSASIAVQTAVEIKELFLEFREAGVQFHQTLKKEPWSARDFIVRDPDGNLLHFVGPAH
jgi:catechol 2,3-dioxygenase-like lactoylglutathione lyase family enzyme